MAIRYFLAMRCSRSKEQRIIPLTAPPKAVLDVPVASSVCLIHKDQFAKHFVDGDRSKCGPVRVLFQLDLPDDVSVVEAKAAASEKALPLFETVFPSSDGE